MVFLEVEVTPESSNYGMVATMLRADLRDLGAPATVWCHVWTCHLPEFLLKWGTLYPFVCHGVEGKHRIFKQDLKNTLGNTWSNGAVGFGQTLVLDRIRWALLADGLPEYPRYCSSRTASQGQIFPSHIILSNDASV